MAVLVGRVFRGFGESARNLPAVSRLRTVLGLSDDDPIELTVHEGPPPCWNRPCPES